MKNGKLMSAQIGCKIPNTKRKFFNFSLTQSDALFMPTMNNMT